MKEKLSNTLRLNFSYLRGIRFLHPCYHPKEIGHIKNNVQKYKCGCFNEIMSLITMKMKIKIKKHPRDTPYIDPGLDINASILNIKCV